MTNQEPTSPELETTTAAAGSRLPRLGRRGLLAAAGATTAAAGISTLTATPADAAAPRWTTTWDKTFPRSKRVHHRKLSFPDRLGNTLVAEVYWPKGQVAGHSLSALAVGGPFGAVKEQASGLYAQTMAERGFLTVAYDPAYNGESSGHPRYTQSPEAWVEGFSAAVDYLGIHPLVNRERIGVIGICGSGGFSLGAAEIDPRIKAIATSTMYDIGRIVRQGLDDVQTDAQRRALLASAAQERWVEAAGGQRQYTLGTPWKLTADSSAVVREFYSYYRTPRGSHPRATTQSTVNSAGPLMESFPMDHLDWVAPRPILFVHGEKAFSRYFSEDAYKKVTTGNAELYIVPGANHVDLYDNMKLIPWNKFQSFFTKNL